MFLINKWLVSTLTCGAIFSVSINCFAARNAGECLLPSELKAMEDGFWAAYPSTEEFSRYAASGMDIATNVVDVANISAEQKTGPARAAQLAFFLAEHPEYYSSFKTKRQSTYLYYVVNQRSVDTMRASHRYPAGECVSMFRFESNDKSCIAGQRVRVLSLSFIKDADKISLQGAQIAMESCQ